MARIEKTVFISYRRTNTFAALAVYQNLHANGFDTFFDYKNIPSGDFAQTITENITARAHFVIILSPSALERCHEPGDWLRREIETAMDYKRNIIPLMIEGFDFGSPSTVKALTGKLMNLRNYNAISIPVEYFDAAMDRLRSDKFLNRPIESVSHPVSINIERITQEQKASANEAPPVTEKQLTAQEWFERGYAFDEDKNIDEAIRCYSEALRLDPSFDVAYYNLGNLLSDFKRYEEAEANYKKAIELNPALQETYYNLGNLLSDLKRYEEAEAHYKKAIELNPTDAKAYCNLGVLLSYIRRYEEAEINYNKAIELNPAYAKAYGNLACLKSILEDKASAFEYLEIASKLDGFDPVWAWEDSDLENLRGDPRFVEIVGEKPE